LPRPGPGRSGPRSSDGERDRDAPRRSFPPKRNSDEEALALRDTGKSYAAVASALGFKRAVEAQAAFIRALRRRPDDERARLTQRESERLDKTEVRIRDRDATEPDKMTRRLEALENLRQAIR
jgi:hypothetical protein